MQLRLARLLVLLSLLAPSVQAVSTLPLHAGFTYDGELHLEGTIDATCPSWGARLGALPAAGLTVAGASGRLILREVWSNVTRVADRDQGVAPKMHQTEVDLGSGPFHVVPAPDAAVALYPMGTSKGRSGGMGPFDIHVTGTRADLTSPRTTPPLGYAHWSWGTLGPVMRTDAFFGGRELDFDGVGLALGEASVYLRGVRLLATDGTSYDVGPYLSEEVLQLGPEAELRKQHYRDGFLDVENLRVELPPGSSAVCDSFHARIDGGLSASDAEGWAQHGPDTLDFADRVLSLVGRLTLAEKTRWVRGDGAEHGNVVEAQAEGDIAALGLDYSPVAAPSSGLVLPLGLGLGAALVAGLIVAKHAGSLVGVLYARFGGDRVLDHPRRSEIYARVQERPGLDLSQLAQELRCPLNSLIYHVRVLQRTGKVGTIRHGKSVRVLARDAMPVRPTQLPRSLLAWDGPLRFTTELLATGPQPLSEVVARLAGQFQLTRRGALHAIDRGVRRGLLVKEPSPQGTRGRGTVLRCA